MNTKIIFTRYSPIRTVLVNEATGQELYRIDTPRRFGGRATRVFRRGPVTPSVAGASNPMHTSQSDFDADEPHEGSGSDDWNSLTGTRLDGFGGDGDVAGEETLGEDSPLIENEIARWYWKLFSSPRLVFEGKVSTRAEYMPLKGKLTRG